MCLIVYVNESRHICVPKFISIYMNMNNTRSYNLKQMYYFSKIRDVLLFSVYSSVLGDIFIDV